MKLIDVSVLKEWVENWFTKNRFYHPYAKNNNIPITELYDILEQMPSAQSEQRWIPVSERLPERNQICIVTDETRRCAYEYGLHDETYDKENGWTYLGHKIIAWMPLPEPYKERITDESNVQDK